MAKELTLEELMNSSTRSKVVKTTDGISTAKEISINDLAKNLPEKEETEENKIKNPVIVEDAFKAMHDTLNEKKRFISEEVMPIVEENAREMALEKEIEDITGEQPAEEESKPAIPDVDELDELLKDDEDEDDTIENKVEEVHPEPEVHPTTVEAYKPEVVEEKKPEPKNELTNDINELDNLFKEEVIADDSDDDDTDDIEEETTEEARERLKKGLTKIKVEADVIDLSKFTIRQKPVSSSTVLNNININKVTKKADWALLATGRSITMSEGSGPELDALRKTMSSSNNVNSIIAALKLLYNHTEDANKPSFEAWCKSIMAEDIESLYFAFYRACYSDVNLIGRTCEKEEKVANTGCGKTSVIEHDIDKMAKFADDETKKKFDRIFAGDTTMAVDTFKSTIFAASDSIAIAYAQPTLYSALIQFSTLNPDILNKYEDELNTLAYITGFYYIDKQTQELIPMQIKDYPNNLNKTVLSKLKVYANILKTLTPDQYDVLLAKLSSIVKESKVTYVLPEVVCPECGHVIKEEAAGNMLDLVFQRRQLAQIRAL